MFKRLFLALAAACLALFSAAIDFTDFAVGQVAGFGRAALNAVTNFAAKTFAGPVDLRSPIDLEPAKRRIAAEQYIRRVWERSRPHVEPGSWRMCPST